MAPTAPTAPTARTGAGSPPDVAARVGRKVERVHVLTGAICNNNCLFCMEDDRAGRFATNSATTDEVVKRVLEKSRGCEEVCFTSGEPTLNPRLPVWTRWAREHQVRTVSVMTNGRALSYERLTKGLVAAGMNRFYLSIHGHEPRLHDALTRTPGAFAQAVAGLEQVSLLKRYGVALHTSTVVTRSNLPFLTEIYRFLRARGVDQVVFNVMQANGRAATHFDALFPPYREIAAAAKAFLDEQGAREQPVMAFLVDIPLCTTTALPDFNRGYVESYVHYGPGGEGLLDEAQQEARSLEGGGLVAVRRSDLDERLRLKRPECGSCRYDPVCEGVWRHYLDKRGWDELTPVP